MKKKWLYITGSILLLFVLTNPSLKALSEYRGRDGGRKQYNFLVCSVYYVRYYDGQSKDVEHEYLGILGNFFQLY